MALSNIIQRIFAHAEEEAKGVIAEAEQRAGQIKSQARTKAEAYTKEARERAAQNAETHRKRLITLSSLDLRKQIGDARQGAINSAFARAVELVGSMNEKEYLPLLKALIVEAASTGEEQIVLSPKDRARVDDAFLESVNKALVSAGKKGGLTYGASTRPMLGGAILVGENVEINCTFDSTLKLIRDDIEPEVASLLWSDARSK